MGLNYGCEDEPTPDNLTSQIMDTLGTSYQTAGYIASALQNHAINSVTPATITLATAQSDVYDQIAKVLGTSSKVVADSLRSIATQTYGTVAPVLNAAAQCKSNCEASCGSLARAVNQTLGNNVTLPNGLTPQENYQVELQAYNEGTLKTQPTPPSIDYKPIQSYSSIETCPAPTCNTPDKPLYVATVPSNPTYSKQIPIRTLEVKQWFVLCRKDSDIPLITDSLDGVDQTVYTLLLQTYDIAQAQNAAISCANSYRLTKIDESPNKPSPLGYGDQPVEIPSGCDIDFYSGPLATGLQSDATRLYGGIKKIFSSYNPVEWLGNASDRIFELLNTSSLAYSCDNKETSELQELKGALQLLQDKTGISNEQLIRRVNYDINRTCPTIMPSADDALRAFLSGGILDVNTLKNYVLINGHCWEPFKLKIQADRSKFIPDEIFALERRGLCTGESANDRLRQLGYIDPSQYDCLRKLQEFVPGPQDIVRFMVRDTDDDKVVDHFHLDDRFKDKYKGELSKWGKWQGIPDDTMLRFWRSHWQIPGVSELSELYQRNRRREYGDKALVTIEDVHAGFLHNDILPFWQDKLDTLLFRPISQRYIYEVFHYGGVDTTGLFEHLCYIGYSDADAQIVTNGFVRRKNDAIYQSRPVHNYQQQLITKNDCTNELTQFGYEHTFIVDALDSLDLHFHSHRDILLYKEGKISYTECVNRLAAFGILRKNIDTLLEGIIPNLSFSVTLRRLKGLELSRPDAIAAFQSEGVSTDAANRIVESVAADIEKDLASKCRDNVKHDFIHGGLDKQQAINKLVGFDIALEWANQLIASWSCELASQSKTVPASTLCTWFEKGLINPQDYAKRLTNIGYSQSDATFIVGDCIDRINQKQQQALEKQLKKLQSEQKALQKELEKEAAADDARAKQLQKAREKAAMSEAKRKTALMSAAAKYSKNGGVSPDEAASVVLATFVHLKNTYSVDTDTALTAIQKAADSVTAETASQIQAIAADYLALGSQVESGDDGTQPIPLTVPAHQPGGIDSLPQKK